MSRETVSILVVSHNHDQHLPKLIQSLEKFNYHNTYFCEAASTDNSAELLKNSKFHDQTLYKTTLESFSKNNNDLIRHFNLNSDYYLLLNPDTYFEEDFLEKLLEQIAADPQIAIIAPRTLNPDGSLQISWKKFPSVWHVAKKRLGYAAPEERLLQSAGEIDWCLGSCMLIHSQMLRENQSLLDERYRLYCEDVDICFDAHQRGLKVVGTDDTYIYHHLHESSAKNIFSKYNRWNVESILKFAMKWNLKFLMKR
ncbi:MAG: glycosyltransferase family 2 protein [Weeksellaceae bacterium]|nr:glycosyltransferase family 2 protein [Weeksellaceae bacterium]